jgi:hypothetical protein
MSIEQKIAALLEESEKLKLMEESEEELDEEELDETSFQHARAQQNRHDIKNKKIRDGDAQGNKAAGTKIKLVHVARSYAQKNEDFTLEDYSVEEIEDFMMSEDFEQLDELSKKTLGSYMKKASSDRDDYKRSAAKHKAAKKVLAKEDVDVQEDVDALLFGEDLSEDFKVKAATIFEAAVMARVNAEVAALEEAFETSLAEQAEIDKEEIIEKVDGYLGYIAEQWMSDNEIAIENGLKSDILEGFVEGLKTLFQEHYIEVPEERFDIVGDLQEQVEHLESRLDESVAQNISMTKDLNEMARESVTSDFCSGMTDTEVEKFTALAEELNYGDADTYASKLQVIKENYFGKKPSTKVNSVVTDSPVQQLNEETKHIDSNVARYMETFNRIK